MKFNIYFTMRGPAGVVEVPNNTNPVECDGLAQLLAALWGRLPRSDSLGLETVGLRVEPAEEAPRP